MTAPKNSENVPVKSSKVRAVKSKDRLIFCKDELAGTSNSSGFGNPLCARLAGRDLAIHRPAFTVSKQFAHPPPARDGDGWLRRGESGTRVQAPAPTRTYFNRPHWRLRLRLLQSRKSSPTTGRRHFCRAACVSSGVVYHPAKTRSTDSSSSAPPPVYPGARHPAAYSSSADDSVA